MPSTQSAIFRKVYETAFGISPIFLVGGLADFLKIPGGVLPLALVTEGIANIASLVKGNGLTWGKTAQWLPVPGTQYYSGNLATVTYFNQITAANAVIKNPNKVSMQLIMPQSTIDGVISKVAKSAALSYAIEKHIEEGGYFTILTPFKIYFDCVLTSMTDMAPFTDENKQVQYITRFDFTQVILQPDDVESALGSLMSKVSSKAPFVNEGYSTGVGAVENVQYAPGIGPV